jgi:hypothetical protein
MTSFTNDTNIKAISDVTFHSKDYIYSLEVNKAYDHPRWQEVMQMKYDSIMRKQTCELINLPSRNIHVSYKWMFKIKFATNGNVDNLKDKLVAWGFELIDF